jgi:hypothetical protein
MEYSATNNNPHAKTNACAYAKTNALSTNQDTTTNGLATTKDHESAKNAKANAIVHA